jgi:hypothetical protein
MHILNLQRRRGLVFLKRMTFVVYSPIIARMTGLNLGLPVAWVVKCKKCGCTINCRAIDPQIEHSQPDNADPPPHDSVIVTCSCCWAAYRYSPAEVFKSAPGPSSNCYDRKKSSNQEERKPKAVLCEDEKIRAHRPQLLRFSSPAGLDRPKQLVCLLEPFAARDQLWRIAGCGLSAIGVRPTPWEFHRSQLSSNSQKTRVEKAIAESAGPGAALAARKGWLVART